MGIKHRLSFIACLLLCISASGQFYSTGDDPGGLKWYSISTPDFRIIYPEGLDSLAIEYGTLLEQFRSPVGASIGVEPNGKYRKPMPVILHAFTADANGVVTWAPRRMDLFTGPAGRNPDVMDWETNLVIHESRHVSQMQAGRLRGYKLFNWLSGDLFGGAMAALYAGPALFEGDAVVAETALTGSGRGREADFLEYYRVSFDAGDFRNWYQWRWGSQRKYTPDHYKAGYMLVGGVRSTYDDPLFAKKFYDHLHNRPGPLNLPFFNLQYTVKDISGKKFREAWQEICEVQNEIWKTDEISRGPFVEPVQFTPSTRRFTEYLSPTAAGNDIIAVRQSLTSTPRLVKIDASGKQEVIRPFSSTASSLQYSEPLGKLLWSESVPDPRWSMKSTSRIMTADNSGHGKKALTKKGRLYNPAPSPSDHRVAASEYPVTGASAVVVLDGRNGQELERYQAPDSLQVVETAWVDGGIAASAISPGGFGIYSVTGGYALVLAPQPAKIKQLRSSGGRLYFVSDRSGVNELYRLDGDTVIQCSNNRFGASDFLVEGDSLCFSALDPNGRMLYKGKAEERNVEYGDLYRYPVADKLSAQEASLRQLPEAVTAISEPTRYHKAAHLFRFHSWLPVFVNYDEISASSFESIFTKGLLGATAFFQNDLGTSSGFIGCSVTHSAGGWNHSAHAKFTYSGLYPVIELSGDFGDRDSDQYFCRAAVTGTAGTLSLVQKDLDTPYFSGTAKIYVPLNFSSGGWSRGLIPQLNYGFSNDILNPGIVNVKLVDVTGNKNAGKVTFFNGAEYGKLVPLSRISASIRGYSMLGTAHSGIYPRWGIGFEAGASRRPGDAGLFTPNAFSYLYGYLPGAAETHSIKLTATSQFRMEGKMAESYLIILPRGAASAATSTQSYIAKRYPVQNKLTVDYIMPALPVDWAGLGPITYVRNFEVTGHFDYGFYCGSESLPDTGMFSAGIDIAARLANLLWIPYDTRIGVSYSYSGGNLWDTMKIDNVSLGSPHNFSLTFSIDL